ncbi:MAG: DUF3857 domain-containing protein [Parafilimonas sp.]
MKRFLIISILVIFFQKINAQDYNIFLIPDSLKKHANVVERYSELHLTIINEKKARLYEKEVFTILNEAGQKFADYLTRYDQFTSINDIDGTLYNALGKKMKEVRKKDISDHAAFDGYSLMNDARYKEHNFYCSDYPYTVEYEEDDDVSQLFYLPTWDPQISALMSVQYSKLVVEAPADFKFRYKQFNLSTPPQITQGKNTVIYTWEVKNLTTKQQEILQPSWREILPSVMLAPSSFGVGDYEGNMDTWQNYGNFVNALRKGRDVLPDDIKQKVHALTDNVKDPHEKINILYNYLQQNSRYVSVQLGVGGWQPFDAKYVTTNKYGDCKALSNYMVSLLHEAGIKADYVLIDAGPNNRTIYPDFPLTEFNHATVCVPLDKDSVWLECTSQTKAAGFAGGFTGDRYALLTDENGGHIVATPRYTSKENQVIRNIDASLDATGNLSEKVSTRFTGCETDDLHGELEGLSKQQFDELLKQEFDIPTYDIKNYTSKETKSMIPVIDESFDLTASNYASVTGKRIFLKPNLLTNSAGKMDTSEQRKYDIVLKNSFKHIDSITIDLASDYTIESLPKDVVLNSAYGMYSIHFQVNDKTVLCVRTSEQNASRFPASDYSKFGSFINDIYKADRSKIVFVKKDN